MNTTNSILIAIRTLSYQGGKILGNRWLPLVDALRQSISKSGFEHSASSDELLLFTYPHPFLALTSMLESMQTAKETHGWRESHGPLPVQIVIHLIEENDALPQIQEPSASEWDLLQHETVYITRPLKRQWDEMMSGRKLPEHSFEDEGDGFFLLNFAGKATVKKEELFHYRDLPIRGTQKECFYCGMTNHVPGHCPSKLVSMKIRGMEKIGYLPFNELNVIYKKIFPDYSACSKKLAAGIKPAHLRKDKELLVFVSYFDLNYIYQLRFLSHMAFCTYTRWKDQDKTDKMHIDSSNLHMGLDCLRVGNYLRAEELLAKESKRKEGKQFYASIGLAFWALEQGRNNDMGHYLERAKNVASQEKERLYIQLLLSRYYELVNDSWKAKEALNNASKIDFEAVECQYRKMQHNVRYGFDEQDLKRIRSLMVGQREIFMSVLMDPLFLPVQGLVNDLAIQHIQQVRSEATKNIGIAEAEYAELRYWFDEKDPIIVENHKSIRTLQKQFSQETYYDLLDVQNRAKGIAYSCQKIRQDQIAALETRKNDLEDQWKKFESFWRAYPYKTYFKAFTLSLTKSKGLLNESQVLMAKKQGQEFQAAIALLDQVEAIYSNLTGLMDKMLWLKLVINGLRKFIKNVVISELALFFAGFIVFLALPFALQDSSFSAIGRIMADPILQKKSMLVAGFFLAPMIALIWTLWKMKDEQ